MITLRRKLAGCFWSFAMNLCLWLTGISANQLLSLKHLADIMNFNLLCLKRLVVLILTCDGFKCHFSPGWAAEASDRKRRCSGWQAEAGGGAAGTTSQSQVRLLKSSTEGSGSQLTFIRLTWCFHIKHLFLTETSLMQIRNILTSDLWPSRCWYSSLWTTKGQTRGWWGYGNPNPNPCPCGNQYWCLESEDLFPLFRFG